jgi:hypothetical protein
LVFWRSAIPFQRLRGAWQQGPLFRHLYHGTPARGQQNKWAVASGEYSAKVIVDSTASGTSLSRFTSRCRIPNSQARVDFESSEQLWAIVLAINNDTTSKMVRTV